MDGKTIIECCAQIAKALFIDKSDSKWAAAYRKVVSAQGLACRKERVGDL